MKKQKNNLTLECEDEYSPTTTNNNDDDRLLSIKQILFNDLTQAERNAIIFYSECGSQRQLATALGVSLALTNHYLKNIKTKIKQKLEERCVIY